MTKILTKNRSTAPESTSESRKRVIAWMKDMQASGGFRDHCRKGAPFLLRSEKSAFLFRLVVNCNVRVMEIFDPIACKLLSLLLARLTLTKSVRLEETYVNPMKRILENLVAEAAAVEDAVVAVSHAYLDGQEILFSDMQKELAELNQERQELLRCYNSTAAIVGFAPIKLADLEPTLRSHTSQMVAHLVTKSRADAKLASGQVDEARKLLSSLVAVQPSAGKLPRKPGRGRGERKTNT